MNAHAHAQERCRQGLERLKQNKPAEAESCFRAAIALAADWPDAHNNLGVALTRRGQHADALASYERAVAVAPDYVDARMNLGDGLRRAGRMKEAITHYREAVRLRPGWAEAHNTLGLALRTAGEPEQAAPAFRACLRIKADHPHARNNLGLALLDMKLYAEAVAVFRQCLRRDPKSADVHNNLGVALANLRKKDEAIEHYRRALELRPGYAEAYSNLGNALRHFCKIAEAEAAMREALRLRENYPEAWNNLAIILTKCERLDEAIECYGKALALKPDYPEARKNMGMAYLAKGDYKNGWPLYEGRWKELGARDFTRPRWDGGPLEGKTILLYAEQGLGDIIQFIRFVPLVVARGGRVIVECQAALVGLFAQVPGISQVVVQKEPLPPFDVHAPLMSVPGILGIELDRIPASVPYLTADADRVRRWGEELKTIKGYKIGIAWQGSKGHADDHLRSVPLKLFEPIARIDGVQLVSLQKGDGVEQLRQVPGWNVIDIGSRLEDFLDTAAVMKHLDLVIAVDTSLVHLAGALGVPAWVAVTAAPDWRWLHGRSDSPWYPTITIFRQEKLGEWPVVFERMARELESRPPLVSAERYDRRGLALLKEGKAAEALALFDQALVREPAGAVLHHHRAMALERMGKKNEAEAAFREALRLRPDLVEAQAGLADLLRRGGKAGEAETLYRKAMLAVPDSTDLCNNLGIVLLDQYKHGEAEVAFRRAIRLDPRNGGAHNNLGVLLERVRRVDEAIASYEESLRIKADALDTQRNLALARLLSGDWLRGWSEYECRARSPQARKFAKPRWDGKPLRGETVLLHAEQGLGDTIQFVRYAWLVKERGATVVVECPAELAELLRSCPGVDRVVVRGSPLPDFAYHLPLLSLPAVFCTTVDTVPAPVPYLAADARRIERWREELVGSVANVPERNGHVENVPHVRIGIAWQGSKRYGGDAHRSAPLRAFAPLAAVRGVQVVSLQKGHGSEQLKHVPDWNVIDLASRLGGFANTAAVMAQLDLVICVDTAVGHLAGALGVPAWLALSTASDWRWLLQRDTTPWYPTVRLFRQPSWGDWAGVFERMAEALQRCARGSPDLARGSSISRGPSVWRQRSKVAAMEEKSCVRVAAVAAMRDSA